MQGEDRGVDIGLCGLRTQGEAQGARGCGQRDIGVVEVQHAGVAAMLEHAAGEGGTQSCKPPPKIHFFEEQLTITLKNYRKEDHERDNKR